MTSQLTRVTCTDSGRMEEIREEVADQLQAKGVIHQMDDGWVADSDAAFIEALTDLGLMICDFCSSPDVSWMFPAEDFTMSKTGGIAHISRSDWAACEICHHLIEQRLWDDLARRAVQHFETMVEGPAAAALLTEVVRANNARFERNRTGPAVRVQGGE